MKQHKGYILLETIISLTIMMTILAFVLPLFGNISLFTYDISQNIKKQSVSTFTQAFMEEHWRNNKNKTQNSQDIHKKNITYYNFDEYGNISPYNLRLKNDKWYVKLYNNHIQPVTEDEIKVKALNDTPFYLHKNGLLEIKCTYEDKDGKKIDVETAILSLSDYFKKGGEYE